DNEVVEGPAGVLSGDLENEIPPGARPESKPLVGCEHLRGKSCHVVSSRRDSLAIYFTLASISRLLHNVKYRRSHAGTLDRGTSGAGPLQPGGIPRLAWADPSPGDRHARDRPSPASRGARLARRLRGPDHARDRTNTQAPNERARSSTNAHPERHH